MDRSYADVDMPGASSPDGLATLVSSMPSWPAAVFILSTVAGIPPSCMASACAASLPDASNRASSNSPTVYWPPGPIPTRLPTWSASSCVPTTGAAGFSSRAATRASNSLISDAGRCLACGALAASTAPVSRSCNTHDE
jgi:hypothetical protein